MTTQVHVFPLHVGNQITKPEVISLLEQGEEPWSMEPAYPLQGTCPGESRPQVGVRNLPPSPTFWEKGWGHEEFTSSESITVPSKKLHPLYYFQSKNAHLLNKVAIFVSCSFPPYLSYYLLSLLSKKTSHSVTCFLIFYCKTCILVVTDSSFQKKKVSKSDCLIQIMYLHGLKTQSYIKWVSERKFHLYLFTLFLSSKETHRNTHR